MKKENKISLKIKLSAVILLTSSSKALAPYQNPQIESTITRALVFGSQIKDITKIVMLADESGTKVLYAFDVLASDFTTVNYHSRFALPNTALRHLTNNHNDADILFVTSVTKLYVFQISSNSAIKTSEEWAAFTPVRHLGGTNFVFTGSAGNWVYKYDYTDTPFAAVGKSQSGDVSTRDITLLEQDPPTIESAWIMDGSSIKFFDKTGSLQSATKSFTHAQLNLPFYVYNFMTPNKVVFVQQTRDEMGMVDGSGASVVSDYFERPCGVGVVPRNLSPIQGTTKAVLACDNNLIKLTGLSDGLALPTTLDAGHQAGVYAFSLRDRRITLVYGSTAAGETKMTLWDVRAERPCHSSCGGCDYDATATGCTSCPTGKVLRLDGSCADTCGPTDEYVDESGKCQKCHSTCLTCSAGGPTSCLTCPNLKFKRTDNSCQDSCAKKEYQSGPFACSACYRTCGSCPGPLPTECSSCDTQNYMRSINTQECSFCTRETCPRCPKDSRCEQCLKNPSLSDCSIITEYSFSLETRGDLVSGEISIHLIINLKSNQLNSEDLKFMLDYEFFINEANTIEFAGNASYDSSTNRLREKGQIVGNSTKALEFLVYQAPNIPLSDKEFDLSVRVNNTVIKYEQLDSISSRASQIISNQTKTVKVVIPTVVGPQLTKASLSNTLNQSVRTTRVVGTTTSIASSVLLFNSLGVVAKMFQAIEFILNLSFVNSKLGILLDNVIKTLRSLKFPLQLPSDFFWEDYERAAEDLFWKSRFKLTKYEKQLFILCNETLVVIVYLMSGFFG